MNPHFSIPAFPFSAAVDHERLTCFRFQKKKAGNLRAGESCAGRLLGGVGSCLLVLAAGAAGRVAVVMVVMVVVVEVVWWLRWWVMFGCRWCRP